MELAICLGPIERGSKFLSGFFDGKDFAYGGLRNPRFSLQLTFLDKRLRRVRWQRGEPQIRAYGGLRRNMRNDFASLTVAYETHTFAYGKLLTATR